MFTVFDTKWLHGTNSIATFCNLANHRLRFVLKCKEVIPSVVDFEYAVRDVLDEEYEKELMDHLAHYFTVTGRMNKRKSKEVAETRSKRIAAIKKVVRMLCSKYGGTRAVGKRGGERKQHFARRVA